MGFVPNRQGITMLDTALQAVDSLVTTIDPETLQVPATRIKDAACARELYQKMREADRLNAQNRALVQAMLDGEPPYDDAELIAAGQGHRINLNFGEAEALLESSLGGYVDLMASVEHLMSTPLDRKKFAYSDVVHEYEQKIAEEWSRALREWDKFNFNHLLLANYFIAYGVGFAYFQDELDWRWNVDSMANVFVPRETLATESEIEVGSACRKYQAHQLYRYIRDEKAAREIGWNVEAVKRAIANAMPAERRGDDWETLARELKNNDLYTGYAQASEIRTVHYWVQEFDGKVSHYIGLEKPPGEAGNEKEEFLYENRSRFNEMSEAIVSFTYGIGTNGYYHGIRGLGYKIFPQIQVSNRARCQLVDGAMMGSTVMIQGVDEEAMSELEIMYFGPYTVLSPGFQVVDASMPNLSQNIVPVLADMSSLLSAKTGQYQPGSSQKTERETKFEQQVKVTQGAKLTTTGLILFYQPQERLFRQVGKRMTRSDYSKTDPGGALVHKFWQRCVDRGVPLSAVHAVDWDQAKVTRAIGAGSPEMRLLILDELMQFTPNLDAIGRANLIRDRIAARLGYDQANRYMPPSTDRRIATDAKLAELENALMSLGQPVSVSPSDDHFEHANVHLTKIGPIAQQLEQVPDSLPQLIPVLLLLLEHTSVHVEALGDNVLLQQQIAPMRQMLQQAGEIAYNGAQQLEKMQREAAEAQTAQSGQAAPQEDPKLVQEAIRFQAKIANMQQEAQLKLQIKEQEHLQKMAQRDAEQAQKVLRSE